MLEGMTDTAGNPKPFSRTQVNAKFAHWKKSLNKEQSGKSFVKDVVLSTRNELYSRVERKSQLFTTVIVYRQIVWRSSANYLTHHGILSSDSCNGILDKLRNDIIISVNESLVKGGSRKSHDATEFQLVQQFGISYESCAQDLVTQHDTENAAIIDWSRVQALGRNFAREFSRQVNLDIKLGENTENLSRSSFFR